MTKKPIFYKIYFAVIALFLVLLTVGIFWLNGWLKSYEAAQADNIIADFVENRLKTGDVSYIRKNCNITVSEYEKEENVDNLFKSFSANKEKLSTVVYAFKPEGCDLAYTVKIGEQRVLNVYLKKQSGSNSFLPKYAIMGVEFDKSCYKTVTVSVPQNVEVTINGKKLDQKYRKYEEISSFVANYLKNENAIIQQTAVIDNLLDDNVTVAATMNGKAVEVSQNGNVFSVQSAIEDDIKAKIQSVATEGSKKYASYMQTDATLQEVAAYFDTSCDFYKNIRSSYTDHILEHTLEGFADLDNSEIYKYSENIYSCRVKFTMVLKRNGMTYKDPYNKYVFVRKEGNTFKIIDVKNPENE